MNTWNWMAYFNNRKQRKLLKANTEQIARTISALTEEGQFVVMTFESGKEVKFTKRGDWYDVAVQIEPGVWESVDFPKQKPEPVKHMVIDGINVSVGMSSNDFVEMCLDMPAYRRHDR